MKAFVTGGAGFIGSALVERLLAEGHEVDVVDDLSTGSPARVAPEAALEVVDITDRTALKAVCDAAQPNAVFHLAAQSSVTRSVTDPRRDCEVNVVGTLNVLESAKRHGAPVVFASTGGALYGNRAPLPTPEDFIPAPISPYGASKWAGEAYVTTWREADGLPHTVCRLGNVYGPRQSPHGEAGVVAIFSYHFWRGERPVVYGHGRPTRDYVHVDDVVRAFFAALGKPGTFNIATGSETDVLTLMTELRGAAGVEVEPELAPLRPGELERSCMDARNAREALGWEASIPLTVGLRETYDALVEEFRAERPHTHSTGEASA